MQRLRVTIKPLSDQTQVLVMAGKDEVMRAVLGPTTECHPRAVPTFLEGLSLWHQQAVSVVLCADDRECLCATQVIDALGFGTKNVHYEVEVALRDLRRRGRRLPGLGHFGELRQLCLEGWA